MITDDGLPDGRQQVQRQESMEFIRKIQMNTVRASGPTTLRDSALCTIPLACSLTISRTISTAAYDTARNAGGGALGDAPLTTNQGRP